MNATPKKETSDLHPALRPVHLGLFPTMDSLESVVDMGLAQLPINTPNQLVGILMAYHNTMLKVQRDQKELEPK